jgi:hypothetical protein
MIAKDDQINSKKITSFSQIKNGKKMIKFFAPNLFFLIFMQKFRIFFYSKF